MAMLNADLSGVQAQSNDYSPLPPGDYRVRVTDTSISMTKTTNTPMLKVTLTVLEGSHANRKLWDQFVLNNNIALSRLKSLATAGGHPHPDIIQDSEELHGLPLIVHLKVEDKGDGYGPKNKITNFKKDGPIPHAPATPAAPAAPAEKMFSPPPTAAAAAPTPAASTGKLPWEV